MNEATLEAITQELRVSLQGRRFGKIFQISDLSFAVDLNLPQNQYLFVSVEPNLPRVYLIKRKLKELETRPLSNFFLYLNKRLAGRVIESISKLKGERILKISFGFRTLTLDNLEPDTEAESLQEEKYSLIIQLTGRSANLFLLDANDMILASLRENKGEGQTVGTKFAPPQRTKETISRKNEPTVSKNGFETLSEALDRYYSELEAEKKFQEQATKAKAIVRKELTKRLSKLSKLQQELESLKDASLWKRYGDLIMANLNQIIEIDGKLLVVDYFDENLPTVEIDLQSPEIEKILKNKVNFSPKEFAEELFRRYSKAKRAHEEISKQLQLLEKEIEKWKTLEAELEKAISEKAINFVEEFLSKNEKKPPTARKSSGKRDETSSFARKFVSSDGFEILVGKGAKENDYLTFRFAKSLDFWLHAADYPGSHVIVRNPNRLESLPHQTLIEAAEIAAFFSQAKKQPKAAVNYTQRKFVHKPKSAPPGLVSLSKFKTIIVEPKVKAS
ncbi:MAG: fibronectin-binding domain-containing protein [Acidobacteria bacterium]|jgi:predicted ribosome quality control (RQC) complex YloA/Tae2 family protein|nr:MAG: fibronectin-binding domain-containing protein [Acidobacteriota bacterium]GIU83142.1 MAG: hypothetical protein KatS3mg006_2206 [Pyrinomonadaceae bacterium]